MAKRRQKELLLAIHAAITPCVHPVKTSLRTSSSSRAYTCRAEMAGLSAWREGLEPRVFDASKSIRRPLHTSTRQAMDLWRSRPKQRKSHPKSLSGRQGATPRGRYGQAVHGHKKSSSGSRLSMTTACHFSCGALFMLNKGMRREDRELSPLAEPHLCPASSSLGQACAAVKQVQLQDPHPGLQSSFSRAGGRSGSGERIKPPA